MSQSNGRGIKIYTILQNRNVESSIDETSSKPTINVPMEEQPSTSTTDIIQLPLTVSRDDNEKVCIRNLSCMRRDLLSELLLSMPFENIYVGHFKELVNFEESVQRGDNSRSVRFMKHNMGEKQTRNTAGKGTNLEVFSLNLPKDQDVNGIDSMSKIRFKGNFLNRAAKRREMIEQLINFYDDNEELYNKTMDELIAIEEEFIL